MNMKRENKTRLRRRDYTHQLEKLCESRVSLSQLYAVILPFSGKGAYSVTTSEGMKSR